MEEREIRNKDISYRSIDVFTSATCCKPIMSFLEILPAPCGILSLHTKHHHAGPA
jgi:hypothetical protein